MTLHSATTSDQPISDTDPMPIPITFTFEITDGELKTITALDEQGRSYTVSIKLTNASTTDRCCCERPDGTFKCLDLAQCPCDPV